MNLLALVLVALAGLGAAAPAGAAPEGQITWAVHTTLVPTYFDPAETIIITPFMVLYGLHDALVKPMPGKTMAPSLAESWSMSPDGRVYEFVLRKGPRFHNGEPVTAEDVKFSFERYKGIYARDLKARVAAVETPDAARVRFRLTQPWPDFMTYYGTIATGAGWIVPKKVGGGTYAYGSYPDLDGLSREQATELDRAKRTATLHRMQQLVHERAMFAPIYELAFISRIGRRVEEPGLGLIAGYAFSAPYEDVTLKASGSAR